MRPFRITSFVLLTVLGLVLRGWFGVVVGVAVWIGFRVLMRAYPFPPPARTVERMSTLRTDVPDYGETAGDATSRRLD